MEKVRALHIRILAIVAVLLFASGIYFWVTAMQEMKTANASQSSVETVPGPVQDENEGVVMLNITEAPEEPVPEVANVTAGESASSTPAVIVTDYTISTKKDIEYAKPAGQSMKLDLYLPQTSTKVPLLIWIHGGGLMEGSKYACPGEEFAKKGYAMACIDYRLAKLPGAGCPSDYLFPAQIHDVKAAVRWLRKNAETYGFDTAKFVAIGDSSGGHMAALLGVSHGDKYLEGTDNAGYDDSVAAAIDYYGPVDAISGPIVFKDDVCKIGIPELTQKYGGEEVPYFYLTMSWSSALGGSLGDATILAQAKKATPLTYVDASDPPFLIIHGKQDGLVPVNQSKALADALEAAGVDVTFVELADLGHGWMLPGNKMLPEVLNPTLEFLREHIG
ncbi:alpha/beta hydrolase [Candidatus Woesearchaeota archaeon]|nr:alpha/beta hydrolase [Candidatus Woesearchaeota archaeon]